MLLRQFACALSFVLVAQIGHAQYATGTAPGGAYSTAMNFSGGDPALMGFTLVYTSGDRKFGGIKIDPDVLTNNLLLDYRDVSGNDPYGYTVRFRPWSGSYTGYIDSSSAGICVGTCQFALPTVPVNLQDYVFAIVGFEFRFLGGERSIKKIGISESNGLATMTLNDPSDGDGFSWALRYAYVPANLFTNTNVSRSGNISGATLNTVVIPQGYPVLKSFNFQTTNGAKNIKMIGVYPNEVGTMNIYFSNQQGTNFWYSWSVQLAI